MLRAQKHLTYFAKLLQFAYGIGFKKLFQFCKGTSLKDIQTVCLMTILSFNSKNVIQNVCRILRKNNKIVKLDIVHFYMFHLFWTF